MPDPGPFPCPYPPSPCETSPNPVTGFSSEAEDSTTFIGLAWNGTLPPLNKPFNLVPCEAIAESQVSQADADRLAQNAAVACASPCTQPFQNSAQTASDQCPDGSSYSLTIPAGQYTAENQVLADRLAFTAAVAALRGHSICLGSIAPISVCIGEFYFGQISVVSTDNPVVMEMSGELPDGLSLRIESDRVVIEGTPTSFGTSTFAITATSSIGVVTSKTYQVTISGIVTGSPLPDGKTGESYAAQMQAVLLPGVTPAWSIISGALPDGLALDSATGVISGTPTSSGDSTFTVGVTAGGVTCEKQFTLHTASAAPPEVILVPAETTGWNSDALGFVELGGIFYGLETQHVYTSTDGVNWASIGLHGMSSPNSLTFGNGLFVAGSTNTFDNFAWSSPNGVAWTSHPAGCAPIFVAFGNGIFVGIGDGIKATVSPDGINWSQTGTVLNNPRNIAFGAGLFVTAKDSIQTSPDGVTWTDQYFPASSLWGLAFCNGIFVAVGVNGLVVTSPDGLIWTPQASGIADTIIGIGGGNGLFVIATAFGLTNVYQSTNAQAPWTFLREEPHDLFPSVFAYYSAANVIDAGFFT